MAITLGNSNVSIQSLGFRSMGFSDSRWRSRVVTPSIKRSEKKLVICSNQAENSGDLSTEEDLEKIPLGLSRTRFPTRFFFGASTGAFQVEGSAFGGRGECIWTTFCKNHPEKIADGSNGEIACDSYHRYKEDVQLLADLGMNAYRFSISWPRILPNGRGEVNPEGIQYYKNLIKELHDNRIEPFVTLFHWDVPQALEDEYGGFLDRKIVEDFKNYAKLCYEEFGDTVKHWITMNEPLIFSTLGYGDGVMAPGRCTHHPHDPLNIYFPSKGDSLREPYIVSHNILLAHSEAVRLYKDEYQADQRGKIGITLPTSWFEPYDNNPIDKEAQKRALEFNLGWFMDPLVFGNYPFSMRSLVKERLPAFSAAESKKLKGSYDFIGLNYYTARYARSVPFPARLLRTYNDDIYAETLIEKNGIPIEHAEPGSWINVYPRGLRELLLYIKERYNNPEIYITENGVMEKDENLSVSEAVVDPHRTEYHTLHLHELAEALRLKANVKGYFTWTLLDNFEWSSGYTSRLGLHYIDFSDKILKKNSDGKFIVPDRSRIKKNSALWFKRFLNIKRKTGMTFGPKIE